MDREAIDRECAGSAAVDVAHVIERDEGGHSADSARPRESGDPGANSKEELDSRFRGNERDGSVATKGIIATRYSALRSAASGRNEASNTSEPFGLAFLN